MYNLSRSAPRQIAIGSNGRSVAANAIMKARSRRLHIGESSGFYGGCGTPITGTCQPPVPVCPENLKRYWMPFNPGAGYTVAVAAGATAVFIGEPQKPFKGDRLIIGSGITPYFDVIALEIANIPQSLGSGAVPADMFSEVSTYTEMTFDPAGPGIKIVLTVKNKSSVSQNFQASLTGIAIG
jgi:hypothetical protein